MHSPHTSTCAPALATAVATTVPCRYKWAVRHAPPGVDLLCKADTGEECSGWSGWRVATPPPTLHPVKKNPGTSPHTHTPPHPSPPHPTPDSFLRTVFIERSLRQLVLSHQLHNLRRLLQGLLLKSHNSGEVWWCGGVWGWGGGPALMSGRGGCGAGRVGGEGRGGGERGGVGGRGAGRGGEGRGREGRGGGEGRGRGGMGEGSKGPLKHGGGQGG